MASRSYIQGELGVSELGTIPNRTRAIRQGALSKILEADVNDRIFRGISDNAGSSLVPHDSFKVDNAQDHEWKSGANCCVGRQRGRPRSPFSNSEGETVFASLPSNPAESGEPQSYGGKGEKSRKNIKNYGIEYNIPFRLIAVFLGPVLGIIVLIVTGIILSETKGSYNKRENHYRSKKDIPPYAS